VTDAQPLGDFVLAQLLALYELIRKNHLAQRVRHLACQ
jgi:hypothetical protein